jgi:hypothetical protein
MLKSDAIYLGDNGRTTVDLRAAAYLAARESGSILCAHDGSIMCNPCLHLDDPRTSPADTAWEEIFSIIGVGRIATSDDVRRAGYCMSCGTTMSLPCAS